MRSQHRATPKSVDRYGVRFTLREGADLALFEPEPSTPPSEEHRVRTLKFHRFISWKVGCCIPSLLVHFTPFCSLLEEGGLAPYFPAKLQSITAETVGEAAVIGRNTSGSTFRRNWYLLSRVPVASRVGSRSGYPVVKSSTRSQYSGRSMSSWSARYTMRFVAAPFPTRRRCSTTVSHEHRFSVAFYIALAGSPTPPQNSG